MERNRIPLKLERFLLTIARRRNIQKILVAAVILDENRVLCRNDSLPCKEVDDSISSALDALIEELIKGQPDIHYLGYFDRDRKTRQYNFFLGNASGIKGLRCLDVGSALHLLEKDEADAVSSVVKRKTRVAALPG